MTTFIISHELKDVGLSHIHQWPRVANEDSHILGRFDSDSVDAMH